MHLQTARLIVRPFTPEDLPEFCEINADAEVMRFFFAPQTAPETAEMLSRWAEKLTRYGWLVASGKWCADCALQRNRLAADPVGMAQRLCDRGGARMAALWL